MQFSDIIPQAALCRMAPNSSFFVFTAAKKIYVKECSVALNNFAVIGTENLTPADLQISSDSQRIACWFKDRSLIVIYSVSGEVVARIQQSQGISGIGWAPDSIQLLVFSEMLYKCSIFNLETKSVAVIRNPKGSTSRCYSFSSDGKFMGILQKHDCKDMLGIYFVANWTMLNSISLDSFDTTDVRWTFNDAHLVIWENPINYRVHAVCPFLGVKLRFQPYDFALGVKTVQCSKKENFIAIGSFDEKIRLLNSSSWKLIGELDCSSPLINSTATKIYREEEGKGTSQLKLVDRNNYRIPMSKTNNTSDKAIPGGIGLLEFSPNDTYLACRNDNMPYTVWIWKTESMDLQSVISLNSQVRMMKWDKEDNKLCIVCGADKVLFWRDGVILECSFKMENRKFSIQRFLWSQDCKKMLLFDKGEAIYADLVPE